MRAETGAARSGTVPIGSVPGVTVRGGTVTLWDLVQPHNGLVPDAAYGPEAVSSWNCAVLALPRSLPVSALIQCPGAEAR